ncbi:MAG: hypothetical protein IJW53_03070 [Clostridia bacterium]|nr:hypothetical protein [Clostridia bacterium]
MNKIRDGDLYKVIRVFGVEFALYYGYYDERDREARFNEPIPIYPNFYDTPAYAADGSPFATEMQDACEYYEGRPDEDTCLFCPHFTRGDEMIGICKCGVRRKQ